MPGRTVSSVSTLMKSDPQVIVHLNAQLKNELTATNQYFLHYRMLKHWGLDRLAKKEYEESIGEMKHADQLMERIFMLDGLPNLQDLGKLLIGENVPELLTATCSPRPARRRRSRTASPTARSVRDYVSRDILQEILDDTEEHIDFLETQIDLLGKVGLENYLQSQMGVHGDAEPAPRRRKASTDMIVCVCRRVSDHEIRRAAAEGAVQPRVPAVRARRRDAVRPLRRLRLARPVRRARRRRRRARRCAHRTRPSRRPERRGRTPRSRRPAARSLQSGPFRTLAAPQPRGAGSPCSTSRSCARTSRTSSPVSRRASRRSRSSTSPASARSRPSARRCRRAPRSCRRGATRCRSEIGKQEGQGGDASAEMAEVGGIGDELERSAERLEAIQAELHDAC